MKNARHHRPMAGTFAPARSVTLRLAPHPVPGPDTGTLSRCDLRRLVADMVD
ncbi:hypothetical protein ACUJ46_12225 [Sandaracinobacteroides sp. A072]|uniref:hypothetical protein n=1 Tax=Sandaracinobacteroides sp. A072 TaxID=3461146 RepID=UPI0040416D49